MRYLHFRSKNIKGQCIKQYCLVNKIYTTSIGMEPCCANKRAHRYHHIYSSNQPCDVFSNTQFTGTLLPRRQIKGMYPLSVSSWCQGDQWYPFVYKWVSAVLNGAGHRPVIQARHGTDSACKLQKGHRALSEPAHFEINNLKGNAPTRN